jgi:predicted Co/Zn/Cd cation transporter (cation efflux family)
VLAVLALRFSRRGADARLSWGGDAAEPFVIVIKAATLGALCAYAAIGGIVDNGGREIAVGSAVGYAVVATLGGLAVGLVLRRATGMVPISSAPRPPSGWVTRCCRSGC